MHTEALHWIRASFSAHGGPVRRVIEVGAQDINGSPRSVAPSSVERWVGVDYFDRPGVDWAGLAHRFPAEAWDGEPFDALVSCECFEHDPHWRRSLLACGSLVRPGGLIAVTCATGERPPHGVDADTPTPGYYSNVDPADMRQVLAALGTDPPLVKVERGRQDLCVLATRLSSPGDCSALLGLETGTEDGWLLAVRAAARRRLPPFDGD